MIVLNVFQCLNVTALLFFCILKDKCQMAEPWTWIWVFQLALLDTKRDEDLTLRLCRADFKPDENAKATL